MKKAFRLIPYSVVVIGMVFAVYAFLRGDIHGDAQAGSPPVRPTLPAPSADSITITQNGIELRLVEAQFTPSKSVLTIRMKHPTISEETSTASLFLWRNDKDVNLQGFTEAAIRSRSYRMGQWGVEQYRVELPPAEKAGVPVVFEIIRLGVRRGEPGAGYDTVVGPWRFELTPSVGADSAVVDQYPIGQLIDRSGIQVALDAVELSDEGTTVRYRLSTLLPQDIKPVGAGFRIRLLGGNELLGTGPSIRPRGEANRINFPSLPQGASRFSVEFGPYWASTGKAQTVVISLPGKAGDLALAKTIPLSHKVSIGIAEYRLSLRLDASSFGVSFEPANEAAKSRLITSPAAMVSLADDLSNSYTPSGADTTFSSQNELVSQRFFFEGKLNPEARELRLQTSATGEILRGPWLFEVVIPR